MSDWNDSIKPIASKLYAELQQTHGQQLPALIEALEIVRRRAEIDQTERDWRQRHGYALEQSRGNQMAKDYLSGGNLLAAAGTLFKTLCLELGPQRTVHVLTALEREQTRGNWAQDLASWRMRGEMTVMQAATELGLAVEDVEAIEAGTFSAGPEVMRLVRPALRRVREENAAGHAGSSVGK